MMKVPILFQSMDRIAGKERRSKLIHVDSDLYAKLQALKTLIQDQYAVAPDRMDLHIELTKNPDDPQLGEKTRLLHAQEVDLKNPDNWVYLGRAFVLMTPSVPDYGATHITLAFFGRNPRPALEVMRKLVLESEILSD